MFFFSTAIAIYTCIYVRNTCIYVRCFIGAYLAYTYNEKRSDSAVFFKLYDLPPLKISWAHPCYSMAHLVVRIGDIR